MRNEVTDDSRMVGIERKISVDRPGGISDIDAGYASRDKNTGDFVPYPIQLGMHELECNIRPILL